MPPDDSSLPLDGHASAYDLTAKVGAEARPRRCLKCQGTFPSAWAGERLCPRCKSTKAWQAGDYSSRMSTGRAR